MASARSPRSVSASTSSKRGSRPCSAVSRSASRATTGEAGAGISVRPEPTRVRGRVAREEQARGGRRTGGTSAPAERMSPRRSRTSGWASATPSSCTAAASGPMMPGAGWASGRTSTTVSPELWAMPMFMAEEIDVPAGTETLVTPGSRPARAEVSRWGPRRSRAVTTTTSTSGPPASSQSMVPRLPVPIGSTTLVCPTTRPVAWAASQLTVSGVSSVTPRSSTSGLAHSRSPERRRRTRSATVSSDSPSSKPPRPVRTERRSSVVPRSNWDVVTSSPESRVSRPGKACTAELSPARSTPTPRARNSGCHRWPGSRKATNSPRARWRPRLKVRPSWVREPMMTRTRESPAATSEAIVPVASIEPRSRTSSSHWSRVWACRAAIVGPRSGPTSCALISTVTTGPAVSGECWWAPGLASR